MLRLSASRAFMGGKVECHDCIAHYHRVKDHWRPLGRLLMGVLRKAFAGGADERVSVAIFFEGSRSIIPMRSCFRRSCAMEKF